MKNTKPEPKANLVQVLPIVPETKPVADLMADLQSVYREFMPQQTTIQAMAKRALELQSEIYSRRLAEVFPNAAAITAPVIASFSAREPLPRFEHLLAELAKNKIEVTFITYDPKNFAISLYGQA